MDVSQGRDNWAAMHAAFGWQVPAHFNIAQACCGRWAQAADAERRIAIRAHAPGAATTLSFAQLQREANAMSKLLASLGVRRGDRVAIVMPQRFETAIAYMAVFQMGAVAMPPGWEPVPRANFDALSTLLARRRPIFIWPSSKMASIPGRPEPAQ